MEGSYPTSLASTWLQHHYLASTSVHLSPKIRIFSVGISWRDRNPCCNPNYRLILPIKRHRIHQDTIIQYLPLPRSLLLVLTSPDTEITFQRSKHDCAVGHQNLVQSGCKVILPQHVTLSKRSPKVRIVALLLPRMAGAPNCSLPCEIQGT